MRGFAAGALALLMCGAFGADDAPDGGWIGNAIGERRAEVSFARDGDALELTAAGAGVDDLKDDLGFVGRPWPVGPDGGTDGQIIVRLAALDGPPGASAGIALRAGNAPDAPQIVVGLVRGDPANGQKHRLFWRLRGPRPDGREGVYRTGLRGIPMLGEPPVYLRITLKDGLFAVHKSPTGRFWTPVGMPTGSAFLAEGPLSVGVFAADGNGGRGDTAPARARFDRIDIGPPVLKWRTSWVGNTYGTRPTDGHVPHMINTLYTLPDGTSYTGGHYAEGGEGFVVFDADGNRVRSLREGNEMFGSGMGREGLIASNGHYLFIASQRGLWRTGFDGRGTRRVDLGADLVADNRNVVIGTAATETEIYFADQIQERIRVARTDMPRYFTANNTETRTTDHPVDTAGVAHAAPEAVYQSFRFTDNTGYVVPDLPPGRYTLRLHFAQYDEFTRPGARIVPMRLTAQGAKAVERFVLSDAAGGFHRAAVFDFDHTTVGDDGRLVFGLHRVADATGHVLLCGFEVFADDGARVKAVNLVGPDIGDPRGPRGFAEGAWEGESWELPGRGFPFARPGPMALDRRGELWIIQRPNPSPTMPYVHAAEQPGSIRCYRTDGTFTGRAITDVAVPINLAYDATRDRLLVAENGPDQNLRFYTNLAEAPVLESTFGVPGGLMKGPNPGRIDEPAAGGLTRLPPPFAVGVDATGAVYVNSTLAGSDLRKFNADGTPAWQRRSLVFCNTPDVDPDSDGRDIYTTYAHFQLDFDRDEPGSEWSYVGYGWDTARFGEPARAFNSQSMVRRLGPDRRLIHFTSGQGVVESCKIFRYEGELAIPCGEIRKNGLEIWIDENGDGLESPDESRLDEGRAFGGLTGFTVDAAGNVWLALTRPQIPTSQLRKFTLLGFTSHGAPRYGVKPDEGELVPYPDVPPFEPRRNNPCRVAYNADKDVMVLVHPAKQRTEEMDNPEAYMTAIADWSGERRALWTVLLPDPKRDGHFMYTDNVGVAFHWMSPSSVGDYVFLVDLWGEVNVFDLANGERAEVIVPGPEAAGFVAWEDAAMGMTAFRRKNGEYLIFAEGSGYGGKCNFYRWTPDPRP